MPNSLRCPRTALTSCVRWPISCERAVATSTGRVSAWQIAARRFTSSIAIMVRLEGAALGHADIGGLLGSQARELGTDLAEVQAGDLLIEVLG